MTAVGRVAVWGIVAACLACAPSPGDAPRASGETAPDAAGAAEVSDQASGTGSPASRPACATILSTNDAHGKLQPDTYRWTDGREVGGVATLAAYFDSVRARSTGCPVFILSGGDLMQGTPISNLTNGESTVAAMNAIGYDAMAIGNHEFDWGVETLRRRLAQAEFPFLGANIYHGGTDRHPEWALPYTIVERDGVRVGVIGATTRSTPHTTKPDKVSHLEFRSIAEALDRYIPEVRAQGVDFVVVVMHAGAYCDEAGLCEGEAIDELVRVEAGFDYVVTGHTHSRVETTVDVAPVVQSFANTTAYGLGRLRREADGTVHRELVEIRATFGDAVSANRKVAEIVERYAAILSREVTRVVATLAESLPKDGHEYGLGRLIADAHRSATRAQIAIMNNGGIRRPLDAGPVTYEELFELHPFQNTLVRLQLTGSTLLTTLEHALGEEGRPDAHVSGLTVRYDPDAPPGERIVTVSLDDGTAVEADGVYEVTVNDFMAAGGSGYEMLTRADSAVMTGVVDLEAMVDHLQGLPQPVEAPSVPRWIAVSR